LFFLALLSKLTRVTIPSSVLHLTTTRLEMFPLLPSTVISQCIR
jgi:hypothetical protein